MATDLARLVVKLEAESSKLTTELAKANQKLSRFERGAVSISKNIKRTIGGLFAGFGAAALIGATKRSLEFADSLAKTSDVIGISTTKLQELHHAADLSGISTQALDSSMTAFAKRLGEARAGTGTLVTLLNKMDPALLQAVQGARNVDEAFDLITRRAAELGNSMDRAALLSAAFGRQAGPQMAILLRDGVKGLEDMSAEAHKLGLIMDEEVLRNAESANDAMTNLSKIVGVSLTTAFASLAPEIESFAKFVSNAALGIRDLVNSFKDLKSIKDVNYLQEQLESLLKTEQNLSAEFENYNNQAKDSTFFAPLAANAKKELDNTRAQIDAVVQRLKDLQKVDVAVPVKVTAPTTPEINSAAKTLTSKIKPAGVDRGEEVRKQIDLINFETSLIGLSAAATAGARAGYKDRVAGLKEYGDALDDAASNQVKLNEAFQISRDTDPNVNRTLALNNLNDAMSTGALTAEQYNKALEQINSAYERQKDSLTSFSYAQNKYFNTQKALIDLEKTSNQTGFNNYRYGEIELLQKNDEAIQKLIASKKEEISLAIYNGQPAEQVTKLRTELESLKGEANQVEKTFLSVGESGLNQFFDDLIVKSASVSDAFKAMAIKHYSGYCSHRVPGIDSAIIGNCDRRI